MSKIPPGMNEATLGKKIFAKSLVIYFNSIIYLRIIFTPTIDSNTVEFKYFSVPKGSFAEFGRKEKIKQAEKLKSREKKEG